MTKFYPCEFNSVGKNKNIAYYMQAGFEPWSLNFSTFKTCEL